MARIRTVKPEFFRHEALQDLEQANPLKYPMLVFAGLWGHCDKQGVFEWRPRTLKLDILPFLDFDMAATLSLLELHGLVRKFCNGGKEYGYIPTFTEHQRIGGKEAQESAKNPDPPEEFTGKQRGSTGEALGIAGREGKGREKEGKGSSGALAPDDDYEVTERAKVEYPAGTYRANSWLHAQREIRKRLEDGESADDLVLAARLYREQQTAMGKVGSAYILSPLKFFGPDGNWRGPFPMPKSKAQASQDSNVAASVTWLERSNAKQ